MGAEAAKLIARWRADVYGWRLIMLDTAVFFHGRTVVSCVPIERAS